MARQVHRLVTPEEHRRRSRLFLVLGCGGVVVLVLVMGGVIYARLTGGPALPPDLQQRYVAETNPMKKNAASVPSGPARTATGAQAPPLRQQVQGVAQAVQEGKRSTVTLHISDSDLNQEIARSLQERKEVKAARAYFDQDKVYIVLTVDWQGRDVALTVTAAPIIVNGGLRFGVETAKVGSMNAPAAVKQAVQDGLNHHQSQWSPEKTGVEFETVTVTKGQATLQGYTIARR